MNAALTRMGSKSDAQTPRRARITLASLLKSKGSPWSQRRICMAQVELVEVCHSGEMFLCAGFRVAAMECPQYELFDCPRYPPPMAKPSRSPTGMWPSTYGTSVMS